MEYTLLEDLPLEIKSHEARYKKNSFRWLLFNVRGEKGGVRDECAPHFTKKKNSIYDMINEIAVLFFCFFSTPF